MSTDLKGKRILVTQADTFMGPTLCELFTEMGAEVIPDNQVLTDPALPAQIIAAAGSIDVLVINLAVQAPFTRLDRV
jgi:NAD(P)-dependent dehydrogenase (short-subunit alcohol dehydrogenase family)